MRITRICDALGARVEGVDCSKPLDAQTVDQLKHAWREHHVLVFPDQELTTQQQAAFSLNFGKFFEHPTTWTRPTPSSGPRSEVREIARIQLKKGGRAENYSPNSGWHSDVTSAPVPPSFSILYGKQPLLMEGVDDDTCYCNIHAAYDTLSAGMKEFLSKTGAVHTGLGFLKGRNFKANQGYHVGKDGGAAALSDEERSQKELGMPLEQVHPCVRLHPETGRPALYINANFTDRFEGWTRQESKPLLEALVVHAAKEENIYRHKWKKNDLVCWDNRSVMHRGPPNHLFPPGVLRDLVRTTVTPEDESRPIGPATQQSRL